MKITIRKSWTNVKFLTKNVSSDEKPERIYELIEEYTKLSEVEVCPSILFINIKNQTETDWITDNVEVIIEYLRTVNDENDLNTEKRWRKNDQKVTRYDIKNSIKISYRFAEQIKSTVLSKEL